ncbi:hypothetical protein MEBOL_003339 [Melittangium boletus DSM 14713]|uniref:Uncharacterized protein n=1 Tax=Melittangium boletus DSM 14713 TaxID=1294270 RepID=A0A250IDE6_9BACT|nr:hypothetical protein MEBOL_003339 [Melittangium boletus DSM 14713]
MPSLFQRVKQHGEYENYPRILHLAAERPMSGLAEVALQHRRLGQRDE